MMEQLKARLAAGEKILIDGATGTELEQRDVPMVDKGWNAAAALTHPEVVRQVHEDYIQLGAQVIIANTFSTSRHCLEQAGLGDHFEEVNTKAVKLALEARERQQAPHVQVAAGISTVMFGSEAPASDIALRNYTTQAQLYADAGADFIMLEMMQDIEKTRIVLEAAGASGLPIWLGMTCKVVGDGMVHMGFARKGVEFASYLEAMPLEKVDVALIMHTLTEDVDASLDVLQQHWSGPVGVYAHSGKFIAPNWHFIDIISPEDYATNARRWLDRGVQVIGGCCGIGTAHIERLGEEVA